MTAGTVILLTGVLCAVACSLLGTFLILRKMAMMTDAISHAILPGLVFGYWVASGNNLLLGALGATLAALVTITLVEALQNSGRVQGGEAMGIVFPAMFALGTVLVTRFFSDVHLDTDSILYGNIEFSSFDRLVVGGQDLGPQSLWIMGALVVMNVLFLALFFKELKLSTFDAGLAATLGFAPVLVHYLLMTVLSITTVGAFTAVGAILVVALVIVPAATAYLLTEDLVEMILYSAMIGAASAVTGYWLALWMDGSVSGGIVTMAGVLFFAALLFSPLEGVVAKMRRNTQNRQRFALDMLLMHLSTHERTATEATESSIGHISAALRWSPEDTTKTVQRAADRDLVVRYETNVVLTSQGREKVRALMDEKGSKILAPDLEPLPRQG
jgi:manganese/zinc/iron transport system permease protein